LEVYLRYTAASEMEHDLLLEHPLPEFERIVPYVAAVHRVSLEPPVQPKGPGTVLPQKAKVGAVGNVLSELWDWARLPAWNLQKESLARRFSLEHYDVIHLNNTYPHQARFLAAARHAGVPAVGHVRNPVAKTRFNLRITRQMDAIACVSDAFTR